MLARALSSCARTVFLVVVGLACVGPVAWVVLSSLKSNTQVFGRGNLLPDPFTVDGYVALFTQINILPYLLNSIR